MPRVLNSVVVGTTLILLFTASVAWSGRRKRREPPPEPTEIEEPTPTPEPEPEVPPPLQPLFSESPPLDVGPLPEGLANLSAQGCNACHFQSHQGWAHSRHATAWSSEPFRAAVHEAGTPACIACHLPLRVQHPELVSYDDGDIHRPVTTPNPAWSATLQTEGVTCAACHVRDGQIVASQPVEGAPHPVAWSPDLTTSAACAPCHQLTWPGADQPFYDTFGEWERSAHAAAGVQCQHCHMGPGAGTASGSDHSMPADPARAVSLLVEAERVDMVRGGDPLPVSVRLQNTGAGHAFPTGTPWRGIRLEVAVVGPADRKGRVATAEEPLIHDLVRTLEEEPPWRTVDDTRLPPGGELTWTPSFQLPLSAPGGEWVLRATLTETIRGEAVGEPLVVQEVPLRVD